MYSYQHLYFEKFLKSEWDRPIEGGAIALERPSTSFEEWLYWSVKGMWPFWDGMGHERPPLKSGQ